MADLRKSSAELRRWQSEALAEWRNSNFHGITEVVTGGGKTKLALAAVELLRNENKVDRVVILVPTTSLQDQWLVNLQEDLGLPRDAISVWPEDSILERPYHVLVVNSARSKMSKIVAGNIKAFLIADECHRYASVANAKSLSWRFSATLGLTATADRQYDDGLERVLIPNLGPIIYYYTLAQATEDGVISRFELSNVRVPLTDKEQLKINSLTKGIGRAMSDGDLEKAKKLALLRSSVSKNAISRIAVTISIAEKLRRKRLLIFHESIDKADQIAVELQKRGHRVVRYHSGVGRDMRRDNLRMFKVGLADILVCCRALDEGIDVPEAECAILAASTNSHRQRVQRLGRVLRRGKDNKLAVIHTLYASDQEEANLVTESTALHDVATTKWLSAHA